MMPSYLLYQIKLNTQQIQTQVFRDIKFDTMMLRDGEAQKPVDAACALNLYKLVALIAADNLEEAFSVGNGYPNSRRSRIEKFRPSSSVSVGDVLIDIEAEKAYACCSYGWQQIYFTPTTYAA